MLLIFSAWFLGVGDTNLCMYIYIRETKNACLGFHEIPGLCKRVLKDKRGLTGRLCLGIIVKQMTHFLELSRGLFL